MEEAAGGGSSAMQVCVLLDDLDKWFVEYVRPITSLVLTASALISAGGNSEIPIIFIRLGAEPEPEEARACLEKLVDVGCLDGLSDLLQEAGTAVCNKLPVPWMCNNPQCTNMAGASELELVGGKKCVCARCKVARYCGRSCQVAHLKQHKPTCKRLAARAAAAGPTGL